MDDKTALLVLLVAALSFLFFLSSHTEEGVKAPGKFSTSSPSSTSSEKGREKTQPSYSSLTGYRIEEKPAYGEASSNLLYLFLGIIGAAGIGAAIMLLLIRVRTGLFLRRLLESEAEADREALKVMRAIERMRK